MEALADQAREADVEALLAITDELQAIDEELERMRRTLAAPLVWPCCVQSVSRRRGREANAVVERRRQFRLPT